ncbi:MAG: hypothetical protein ACRBK7_32270 [Acidimicrobiales bacterium]
MRRSTAWPLLMFLLALASCGQSVVVAPEVVAQNDTCPEIGCSLSDDDGQPQRLAEVAGSDEQDAVAERWGYDPVQLPRLVDDQFLVFVAADVATSCDIFLRPLDHQQTIVVLSFEQTQDSGACLDIGLPSSAVVMLSGSEHPNRIRSSEVTDFRFLP